MKLVNYYIIGITTILMLWVIMYVNIHGTNKTLENIGVKKEADYRDTDYFRNKYKHIDRLGEYHDEIIPEKDRMFDKDNNPINEFNK